MTIHVIGEAPARALIEISSASSRMWSFRNEYAGVSELSTRIEGFKAFDSSGLEVNTHKLAPGQFTATTDATRVIYEVKLAPPARAADAARVSWVSGSHGLLMLADLLPASETAGQQSNVGRATRDDLSVRVTLPNGWMALSTQSENAATTFTVADAEKTILEIGDHLRTSQASISGITLTLLTDGDWPFTDAEAVKLATDVLRAHRDVLRATPTTRATLTLLPFPVSQTAEKWSAETRGASVTILLGNQPSKNAALAQLSVPLTHELFHLWVPNGLNLSGDYDWFYEGFTIYQSTRTGVRLGFLTFQDFLNAIARAYDAYLATPQRDQWSLIDASQRRWTVGEATIYSKSMLVAFLYDLFLRKLSNGKRSLEDVYRSLATRFAINSHGQKSAEPADGTKAVMDALDARLPGFAGSYVQKPTTIDLAISLTDFGLQVEEFGSRNRISVSEALTRRQRDLLHNLGYNDSERLPRRK